MLSDRGPNPPRPGNRAKALAPDRFERPKVLATTLAELRKRCAPYGEAAVARAEYGAATLWLMSGEPPRADVGAMGDALRYCAALSIKGTGLPHPEGRMPPDPRQDIAPAQCIALDVLGAETMLRWRNAGSPWLAGEVITRAHQYFIGARQAAGHAI